MHINEFGYTLPPYLIAQYPSEKREDSRLMVINRETGIIEHRHFYDIVDYIKPGDCLVLNDSKVIPARLKGKKKKTGTEVEFLLLKREADDIWETMVRPGRRLKAGDQVVFSDSPCLEAEIIDYGADGTRMVDFQYQGDFYQVLDKVGKVPLPPYITRDNVPGDRERYQTVYCRNEGSVAAPTAGLHFTDEILERLKARGVKIVCITLHVGIGTFRPVKCENIEDHQMHFEEFKIDELAASTINETRAKGGRIISVGTTSTRTLESVADDKGRIVPGYGDTDIFIYPGYSFKAVDGQITNFHLPKSTLLMLVSAFYGREEMLRAYEIAVGKEYRFFSYGDAMLIL